MSMRMAPTEADYLRGLLATASTPPEPSPDFLATRQGWEPPPPQRRVSWTTRVACFYAQCLGLAVFPMNREKRPLVRGGFRAATRDCDQLERWFERWPDALIAAATGEPNSVVVLDVDVKHGQNGLEALRAAGVQLPPTWVARSPSGGCHLYFRHSGEHVPSAVNAKLYGRTLGGVDVRAAGGAIILPTPRSRYRWSVRRPGRCALAPLPQALLEGLRWKPATRSFPVSAMPRLAPGRWRRVLARLCGEIAMAPPGRRQVTLAARSWQAGRLAAEGKVARDEALQSLLQATAEIGGPDWDERTAFRTAVRRFEAGVRNA